MPHDPTTPPEVRTPLVMLHGFTQNGRCIGPIADLLAKTRAVLAPDLPGHGDAGPLADHSLEEAARYIVGVVAAESPGPPHLCGYSMGARVALQAALDHPGAFGSLILLGGTAGIADPRERSARRQLDHERADAVEELGVGAFCTQWLAAPMFVGLPEWARFMEQRSANTVAGLAGSLRNAGTGSMEPLWGRLGDLGLDVLLLTGDLDSRFAETANDMAQAIGPNASTARIPDAGHAAHLEQPESTAEVISEFLERVEAD